MTLCKEYLICDFIVLGKMSGHSGVFPMHLDLGILTL